MIYGAIVSLTLNSHGSGVVAREATEVSSSELSRCPDADQGKAKNTELIFFRILQPSEREEIKIFRVQKQILPNENSNAAAATNTGRIAICWLSSKTIISVVGSKANKQPLDDGEWLKNSSASLLGWRCRRFIWKNPSVYITDDEIHVSCSTWRTSYRNQDKRLFVTTVYRMVEKEVANEPSLLHSTCSSLQLLQQSFHKECPYKNKVFLLDALTY